MQIETTTLFSIGYQLRSAEELIDALVQAGVSCVLDVRETAWSHKKGLSKTALAAGLEAAGVSYRHLRFAGNPKKLRQRAQTHADCLDAYDSYLSDCPEIVAAFDAVVRELGEAGQAGCLLCYERHPADCHRSILIHRWALASPLPVTVLHLGPEGAPRFTDREVQVGMLEGAS